MIFITKFNLQGQKVRFCREDIIKLYRDPGQTDACAMLNNDEIVILDGFDGAGGKEMFLQYLSDIESSTQRVPETEESPFKSTNPDFIVPTSRNLKMMRYTRGHNKDRCIYKKSKQIPEKAAEQFEPELEQE